VNEVDGMKKGVDSTGKVMHIKQAVTVTVTVIYLLSTIILSIIKQHAQLMSWTARQHCCTYNCPLTNYKKKRLQATRQLSI